MTAGVSHERLALVRHQLYIDGQWKDSASDDHRPVVDPATGATIVEVAWGSEADTELAVQAAHRARKDWAGMTAIARSAVLRRWYDLIIEHTEDLARLMTAEQGKPVTEARGEVEYGAGFVEWYAEEGKRVAGEIISPNVASRRLLVRREPVGVTAAITPWNFPMAMITRKAAPALAAGCPIVIKPAGETPLTALALAELADQAGLPAGVFNVVTGAGGVVGQALAVHPLVRALSFTGSTEVGKQIMAVAASNVKKVALELGGNAPLLVFDDADLATAVDGAIASKFRNAGQTCVCANRILVQEGVHDDFVNMLSERVRSLRVGPGFVDDTEIGPLINAAAVDKVEAHISDALRRGARVNVGGDRHRLGHTFFEPTVLTGVTADMAVAQEETFGPVAPIFKFQTEAEAIESANDTPFGLAAYFFSADLDRFWRVSEALEFGVVGVNTGAFSYEGAPFGGMKESGLGREGSAHGMDEFLETKYICLGNIESANQ